MTVLGASVSSGERIGAKLSARGKKHEILSTTMKYGDAYRQPGWVRATSGAYRDALSQRCASTDRR